MKIREQSGTYIMPCESCAVQFSVFRRRRACSECERHYCSGCLRRGGGTMCAPCRVLSTQPLTRANVAHLKVRDLQSFLQRQNVSTRGCVEKEELVSLCMVHVNSPSYRRRGPRSGPFSTLKGFTNNINEFITQTFDLNSEQNNRPPNTHRTQHSNCYNNRHEHAQRGPPRPAPPVPPVRPVPPVPPQQPAQPSPAYERFTTTPGGERDIRVPPPPVSSAPLSPEEAVSELRVDTADCFEIEDLDDTGWEFVNRPPPADPLPNDSDVLISEPASVPVVLVSDVQAPTRAAAPVSEPEVEVESDGVELTLLTPARAASALDLHLEPTTFRERDADSASLQDEPLMDTHSARDEEPLGRSNEELQLEQIKEARELDALNVRQLKQLLARNRVQFRGCLERADLLQRATMLWNDHNKYKDDIETLPIEECCKICMAAPLECVLLECGHIAACTRCSKQLAECPICRQYVVRAVRCFRS